MSPFKRRTLRSPLDKLGEVIKPKLRQQSMLVRVAKNLISKQKSPLSISASRKFSLPGIGRNFNVQEF